jgi:hypothetical protein
LPRSFRDWANDYKECPTSPKRSRWEMGTFVPTSPLNFSYQVTDFFNGTDVRILALDPQPNGVGGMYSPCYPRFIGVTNPSRECSPDYVALHEYAHLLFYTKDMYPRKEIGFDFPFDSFFEERVANTVSAMLLKYLGLPIDQMYVMAYDANYASTVHDMGKLNSEIDKRYERAVRNIDRTWHGVFVDHEFPRIAANFKNLAMTTNDRAFSMWRNLCEGARLR